MSLLPYVVDELLPSSRNHFGYRIYRSLMRSLSNYGDPLLSSSLLDVDGIEKKSHIGKDGFQVSLDVQHFAPNEISVKTVDNSIVVEAKHEEQQDDHGYISRQFTRRYDLPKGFKVDDVDSTISSDGILTVKAPPANQAIEGSNVRQVQIQQTGPARLSVNKNEERKLSKAKSPNKWIAKGSKSSIQHEKKKKKTNKNDS